MIRTRVPSAEWRGNAVSLPLHPRSSTRASLWSKPAPPWRGMAVADRRRQEMPRGNKTLPILWREVACLVPVRRRAKISDSLFFRVPSIKLGPTY